MFLDKDAILKGTKLPRKFEVVDALGGKVKVWQLYAKERDAWERSRQVKVGKSQETNLINFRASFLVHVLRNDDGTRMFHEADIETLGNLPADEADKLFAVGMRLNGLNRTDVDELAKNCEETGGDDSPTV